MKILKVLAVSLAGLIIVLSITAVVVLKVFLPEEKIKSYIADYAKNNFNREVTFDKLSFALIGIDLKNFKISERSTLNDGTFIKAGHFTIKISPLPLLSKKIEITNILLDDVDINISKDKNGKFNFDDIIESFQSSKNENDKTGVTKKTDTEKPNVSDISTENKGTENSKNDLNKNITSEDKENNSFKIIIDSLTIKDSDIHFSDIKAELTASIKNFDLSINDFSSAENFWCDASCDIDVKQKKLHIAIPVKTRFQTHLNNFDLEKMLLNIETFQTKYNNAEFALTGTVENMNMPKIDCNAAVKNINEKTVKDFIKIKNFNISKIDFKTKTVVNISSQNANIESLSFVLPKSSSKISGAVDWSKENLLYNLKINLDLFTDDFKDFFPEYNLKGKILSDMNVSDKNISGTVKLKSMAFDYLPAVQVSDLNADCVMKSVKNITVKSIDGIFNKGKFKADGSFINNDIKLNLDMDKLTIKTSSAAATTTSAQKKTEQNKTDENKKTQSAKNEKQNGSEKQNTSSAKNNKTETYNIYTNININEINVPYLISKNAALKTSLKSVSCDMKKTDGTFDLVISTGTITDTDKLAENKYAKLFLLIFNALNNNITAKSKSSGIDYESMTAKVTFTKGVMQTNKVEIKIPLTAMDVKGSVDFNTEKVDMKVNTGLYAAMKITGTISNPKTSFDAAATVTEILNDPKKLENVGKKLGDSLKNLFNKK